MTVFLALKDSDSHVVITLYTGGLEVVTDPLFPSSGMAIEIYVAAFAMVTVLVFFCALAISFLESM